MDLPGTQLECSWNCLHCFFSFICIPFLLQVTFKSPQISSTFRPVKVTRSWWVTVNWSPLLRVLMPLLKSLNKWGTFGGGSEFLRGLLTAGWVSLSRLLSSSFTYQWVIYSYIVAPGVSDRWKGWPFRYPTLTCRAIPHGFLTSFESSESR